MTMLFNAPNSKKNEEDDDKGREDLIEVLRALNQNLIALKKTQSLVFIFNNRKMI